MAVPRGRRGWGYPVVPEGAARLRGQLSAAHTRDYLQWAIGAFAVRTDLPKPG